MKWLKLGGIFVVILGLAVGLIYVKTKKVEEAPKKDKYALFIDEVWDTIKQNYWDKVSDKDLSNLFLLATKKVTNENVTLKSEDRAGVEILVKNLTKNDDLPNIIDVSLANLSPFGRSRLYTTKEATNLANTVENVSPGSDYFSTLGVGKSATDTEVAQAYAKAKKTPEVVQAFKVLKNADSRQVYEISGVEPTIEYKLMSPTIFYMHLTKFSPTSLDEFARVTAKVDGKGPELDTLILDLRGNIGGAIDGLPYFLGPFIGPDTYAYQFFQQGNKQDFKTLTGWMNTMVRYKKVVILIDGGSQSTAELMAASLKKYNVGVLVGETTKGWGTVEKVFDLTNQISEKEKYSLFLVHHITLRDDGQPIEGRGVEPNIAIKDKNWQKQLLERYNFPQIVTAVEEIYKGI